MSSDLQFGAAESAWVGGAGSFISQTGPLGPLSVPRSTERRACQVLTVPRVALWARGLWPWWHCPACRLLLCPALHAKKLLPSNPPENFARRVRKAMRGVVLSTPVYLENNPLVSIKEGCSGLCLSSLSRCKKRVAFSLAVVYDYTNSLCVNVPQCKQL